MARWLMDCKPVCGHNWRVGVATDERERDALYRLRYEVFVVEQGYEHAGATAGAGRDVDPFDEWCDHLFIYDEERKLVAGTYRAIPGREALRRGGFYASDEFDLSPLAPIAHEILQGGRACVAAEYRSTFAFQYLSYGMELLRREYACNYLLGADSFRADIDELSRVYSYMKQYKTDPEWFVLPWDANRVAELREVPVSPADERTLPEIVRMDLRLGFLACSPPVWDPGFGCYDLMMLGRADRFSRLYTGMMNRIEKQLAAAPGTA